MKSRALVVWVIVMLLFGMAIGAQAESAEDTIFSSGDWRYRVRSDGSLEIVEWNGDKSELVIPATIDGKKVAAIGDGAFYAPYYDHYGLTSVTIPDSVTSIGDIAFYGCENLTSITIPNSITSIGDIAFEACPSLISITIPNSVTSIGINPFNYCKKLKINISPDHPTLELIDNALFYKPEKRLVAYLSSSVAETYTILQGILSIGDYAFCDCGRLTDVTIPDSVTSIGDSAFYDCKGLTSVTIPNSVTSIRDEAFYCCSSLTNITIPDSVTSIGNEAFYYCSSLTGVTIPDSVTSIGGSAFYWCNSLTSITIPDSVTSIGSWAFAACDSLTSITIPNSVIGIGDNAFPNMIQLIVARDSYAEEYAEENHLSYTYADALDWLNQ